MCELCDFERKQKELNENIYNIRANQTDYNTFYLEMK